MAPPKVTYSITPNPSVSPILDDQICRTILEETFGDCFCAPDDTLASLVSYGFGFPACLRNPLTTFTHPLRTNMSVPLATFDLNDPQQQAVATELKWMLDGLNFDEANQTLHLGTYGISPIYDNQVLSMDSLHPERTNLDRRQIQAIEFFMYGGLISPEEASCLFQNNLSLFGEMQNLGLIVADTDETGSVSYRLNNLSIVSHHLPNNNVIYLAVDLPERLRNIDFSKPTAQISETSYVLLNRLEKWYKEGGVTQGVVADFGAGTGLFAIALLKLCPNIEEALAVEIDPQAMNLTRLNVQLNGVANQIVVVDNFEENGFSNALNGRQFDFAISNPPFNVVPKGYGEQFTDFGDGGEKGLDITQIFLDQALPNLKAGGEFMLYSILAEDQEGNYFATRLLEQRYGQGLTVRYEHLRLDNLTYTQASYATVLADYLERNRDHGLLRLRGAGPDQALVSDIQGELNESGIRQLNPVVWVITKTGEVNSLEVTHTDISLPSLETYYHPHDLLSSPYSSPGGVFRTRTPGTKRGVYIELRSTSPLGIPKK